MDVAASGAVESLGWVGSVPAFAGTDAAVTDVSSSRAKRLFDIGVSVLALVVLAPLLLMIIAAILADSKGPVIFRQRRSGLNGHPFVIYKFRTMTVAEDGPEVRQAKQSDQRVTKVGRFLRRASLDELPQFVNVLRGEMSVIGPRPHALSHDSIFAQHVPDYPLRFRARPGLTGLAQVSGHRGEIRDVEAISDRVAADLEYIDNWSLEVDLLVVAKTFKLIFSDPRAY